MPAHRHLSKSAARSVFPSLRDDVMTGAIAYYDGQVDDARYVVTLARTAASLGARIVPSVQMVGLVRDAREVVGARVRDRETGAEFAVAARTVVAATGVWSDEVSALLGDARPGLRVRASKGVHLVVPRSAMTGEAGLILRTPMSVLFVLPWGGHWLIGTTDTDWRLDRAHPAASARDIQYLLSQVNHWLDRPLVPADIEGVYAGLRPLLAGEDDLTSRLSREHAVVEPMLGLLLVAGGKYTTYRVMAADVIDRASRRLGAPVPRSHTELLPLLGADGYALLSVHRADVARRHGIATGVMEHLLERYGSLALEVLELIRGQPVLGRPIAGAPEYVAAEVVYAAMAEGALHLEDVLVRRTHIAIETVHRGIESARQVAALMGTVLGWDEQVQRKEVEHYRALVAAERQSQQMPDDVTADAARLGAPEIRAHT
jgi:glycerol-3-phosphate dehydrogenase